jgi:alpha-glucosidase
MFWQYVTDGIPLLKPLVYFLTKKRCKLSIEQTVIFGNQILVCPILSQFCRTEECIYPKGIGGINSGQID